MTLRLTTQETLSPAARLTISAETIARTSLQRDLFNPSQHDLAESLIDAVQQLAAEQSPGEYRTLLTEDHDVTALNGAYAHLASKAVMRKSFAHRLIEVTRHLGGQTSLSLHSSLEDIRTGPVAIFAAATHTPTIVLELDESFFECKSTQRTRFLGHLPRLSPGIDVRLTGSHRILRKLLERHDDDLPASVTEDAQARLLQTPSTITEQTAQTAADALADLGVDDPAWPLAASISLTTAEQRSYSDLYADESFDVSNSGIRQRLKRLRGADVVESVTINGSTHARLTPVGAAALERHPSIEIGQVNDTQQFVDLSGGGCWDTEHINQPDSQDGIATETSVSNPRTDQHSTVLSQHAHEGGDSQEASPAINHLTPASSSASNQSSTPETRFLPIHEHHTAAAAASNGHFALVDRVLPESDRDRDHREGRYSYDESRDEIVVTADFSQSIVLTAVRLCSALLSDAAFNKVLTPERIADHPDGQSLDGLILSNPYVLRGAACIGWLRDDDAEANRFRDRLKQARRDLLATTSDLFDKDGLNEDVASELLRDAHGLMGTALRVYDLLGIDVIREIRFAHGVPTNSDLQQSLRKFIATATSIGSRHGAYSGYRVLYEERFEKRDDLISEPNVDMSDPDGTLLGSWVFSGENASKLKSVLSSSPDDLQLQENKDKFAPFRLSGQVVDGNRRAAIGEAVTRLLSFKDGISPNRQAISVLAALTSDIVAAGEAILALGGEDEHRDLNMQDIQYGLSQLSWRQICPELGGTVVSKVIYTLVDAQEPLSTAELGDRAGCSTRGLAAEDNERIFSELEAAGMLDRTDLGQGKATEWRLCLPFRIERCDRDLPQPTMLVGRETSIGGVEWLLSDAVFEVFATAADKYGVSYRFDFGDGEFFAATAGPPRDRDLPGFITEYTLYTPMIRLLAALLDQEDRLDRSDLDNIVFGRSPDPDQMTLQTAAQQNTPT